MPSAARSLADDLRLRSDEELLELLRLRPALLRPVPKSFADLALRANSAPSTATALDDLTHADLDVLEACCALAVNGRFTARDVARGLDSDLTTVEPVVASLYRRMLLWGSQDDLRVPSAVREVMGPHAAGLDPTVRRDLPSVRAALVHPDRLREELAAAPRHVRAGVLAAAWDAGALAEQEQLGESSALVWLRSRGLLVRDESGRPLVPREVAMVLRHGLLVPDPSLTPPPATIDTAGNPDADARAGHQADRFLRDFDRVMTELADRPWTRQASGTFGSRDVDRAVTATGMAPELLGLIVALAHASRQLDVDVEGRLRPTTAYDAELERDRQARWALLATTWLCLPSLAADPARVLVTRPEHTAEGLRRLVLTALAGGAGFDVIRWLAWHRPRWHPAPDRVDELLAEAQTLGFATGAAASAVTRHLSWPADRHALTAAVEPLLPPLTDRVILQADLTATALGPLAPGVERRLARIAAWESGGGGTVFRFSRDSVRRGLAAGEDADDLLAWLARLSATEIPQALTVLVTDEARTLPRVVVHAASSVVECAEADAVAMLADPALADLGLRLVAAGVLTAQAPAPEVADRLRAAGHAVRRSEAPGAPVASDPRRATGPGHAPVPERVIRSLRTIETREQPGRHPPRTVATPGPHAVLRTLDEASRAHRRIWLAFADESGARITHLVEPLALDNGDVCAFDVTAGEIRTIPVERIVGAAAVDV